MRVTDYFWIGWRQDSEKFLNAGLDLNTPHAGRQYFLLSGNWQESQAPGTVMMRPVMKGSGTPTSSDNGTLINDLFHLSIPIPLTVMLQSFRQTVLRMTS